VFQSCGRSMTLRYSKRRHYYFVSCGAVGRQPALLCRGTVPQPQTNDSVVCG
jgi:hypothetical protein